MVGLERGRPAGVVGGEVDEEASAARVDGVDELAELVERRRLHVDSAHAGSTLKKSVAAKGHPFLPITP